MFIFFLRKFLFFLLNLSQINPNKSAAWDVLQPKRPKTPCARSSGLLGTYRRVSFVCRLLSILDKLNTKEARTEFSKWNPSTSLLREFCSAAPETLDHPFFFCNFTGGTWRSILTLIQMPRLTGDLALRLLLGYHAHEGKKRRSSRVSPYFLVYVSTQSGEEGIWSSFKMLLLHLVCLWVRLWVCSRCRKTHRCTY